MHAAAALLTSLAVSLGLGGCVAPTGLETVGRTGVTSVEGDLAVVWDTCGEEEVRSVVLHADREGLEADEENEEIGRWELGERNRRERVFVPSAADDPPELDRSRGYVVEAVPDGGVEILPGVHFRPDDVAALRPGEVLVGAEDGSVVATMEDLAHC